MPDPTLQIVADAASVAATAAELIVSMADDAISKRGTFTIALSGGHTPKTLFEMLASDAWVKRIDWPRWEIYWGDERCVGPDDPDSNFGMAAKALLNHVPIKAQKIHRMKGEADPQQAAADYGRMLKDRFGEGGGLDVSLLGMGDDGHTASLFPQTAALDEKTHRCVANFVPKFGVWRLTMSGWFINRSSAVLVLISGAGKADRLAEVLNGPRDPRRLPIQSIQPDGGRLLWIVDNAAAAKLGG